MCISSRRHCTSLVMNSITVPTGYAFRLQAFCNCFGRRRFELGYHEVEIQGQPVFVISAPTKAYFPGTRTASTVGAVYDRASFIDSGRKRAVIDRAYSARLWGIFAPVYSLHSKRNPN